jgi:CubicO group peptidase (beta-lactamase class C family)
VKAAGSLAGAEGGLAPAAERLSQSVEEVRRLQSMTRVATDAKPSAVAKDAAKSGEGILDEALTKLLSRAQETNSDAVMITKDGHTVGEWYFGKERKPIQTNSITKSVTNLAVGRLIGEGKIGLDEPVHNFFYEWMAGPKQDITVRHLLNHTSGLPFRGGAPGFEGSLSADLLSEPGAKFEYSNAGVDVLSGLVEYVSGKRLDRYVASEIFAPMGITDFSWRLDANGHAFGSGGLSAHAADLSKIGQLMIDDGKWNGKSLVGSDWIAESTKPAQSYTRHSGLLWWLDGVKFKANASGVSTFASRDGFSARGINGQFIAILPRDKLVGVRQRDKLVGVGEINSEISARHPDDFKEFPDLVKKLYESRKAE